MRQLELAMLIVLLAAVTAAAQTAPPVEVTQGLPQSQVQAQTPAQTQNQNPAMGRGRGGAPFAWNDRNGDGICDLTGQAVGQRPIGYGRGRGWRMMANPTGTAPRGQGRGGAPFAWNDRNRDGICDLTGMAIGRGFAAGAGVGRGRGAGWRR